jgi:predicted P-loop ATPase
VFIGTTNKTAYLRDETGGRRFWPVKVGTIDTDALAKERDQLFAEAMAAYLKGERWWPSAELEREHIQPEQEKRFEADEWESIIGDWLLVSGVATKPKDGETKPLKSGVAARTRCTVAEVATHALKLYTDRLGDREQRRITGVLRRLGWEQKRDKHSRWWEPSSAPQVTR